ncbi:hypothetical protein SARC_13569 [Sphaeroforma arctica JP610]|uniref:Uncharacterized protein n=1 Tax=Sphaeroforma arctica JP610 TaxID=667725 RepID=A0A0L0FAV2_9EUKA|nr:hypothetical protein SARC_13569 [Sphaeroforma arctica JP610]KNC73874.1 hypothetical protein SARC_13569 [Sphaeroforma arctica JP610]|eukprot:XP_014147776.1 hypothetical protein SARC_13569 [Sphaeroforma arctica JP610]
MLAPETGGKFALPQGTKVKAVIFAPPPVVNNTFVKAIQAQGYAALSVVLLDIPYYFSIPDVYLMSADSYCPN